MYRAYIKGIELPITPGSFQEKHKNKNTTMTLINEGEVNVTKTEGLTEFSFEALLPNIRTIYSSSNEYAEYFKNLLRKLKNNGTKFQLILTREKPSGELLDDTNEKVTLEDLSFKESHADGFLVRANMSFKKWVDYGTKKINLTTQENQVIALSETYKRSTENAPIENNEGEYIVKDGESLFSIAKYFYGDGSYYHTILKANPQIGNPSDIMPGDKIKIPKK